MASVIRVAATSRGELSHCVWRSLNISFDPVGRTDDSWLDVTPAELDHMMEQRYGCKPSHNTSDISSKLANFLSHVSSVEGAEFPQ